MALSTKSITAIGGFTTILAIGATALLAIYPLNTADEKAQLDNMQTTTDIQKIRLQELSSGSVKIDETVAYVQQFLLKVPQDQNLESLSRAVALAAVDGTRITAFNFGKAEPVEEIEDPVAQLSQFEPPFDIEDQASASTSDTETKDSGKSGLSRVPTIITVETGNDEQLSQYLDNLAHQDRLLYVRSVTSQRDPASGVITSTVYAYGYVYAQ